MSFDSWYSPDQAGKVCAPVVVWWNVQCVNGIFPTRVTIGSSSSDRKVSMSGADSPTRSEASEHICIPRFAIIAHSRRRLIRPFYPHIRGTMVRGRNGVGGMSVPPLSRVTVTIDSGATIINTARVSCARESQGSLELQFAGSSASMTDTTHRFGDDCDVALLVGRSSTIPGSAGQSARRVRK